MSYEIKFIEDKKMDTLEQLKEIVLQSYRDAKCYIEVDRVFKKKIGYIVATNECILGQGDTEYSAWSVATRVVVEETPVSG
jgi:uncharacterized protein YhfF